MNTIQHLWAHIKNTGPLNAHERFKMACGALLLSNGIQQAALTAVRECRQPSELHPNTYFTFLEYAVTLDEWPDEGCVFFDDEVDALEDFAQRLSSISQTA